MYIQHVQMILQKQHHIYLLRSIITTCLRFNYSNLPREHILDLFAMILSNADMEEWRERVASRRIHCWYPRLQFFSKPTLELFQMLVSRLFVHTYLFPGH